MIVWKMVADLTSVVSAIWLWQREREVDEGGIFEEMSSLGHISSTTLEKIH